MKKISIYRWQNKEGAGPYTSNDDSTISFRDGHNDKAHPTTFYDDNGITRRDFAHIIARRFRHKRIDSFKIFCGFISMKQMNKWFTSDEKTEMYEEGYDLVELKIDERKIHKMGKQCIFFSHYKLKRIAEIV